MKYQVKIWVDTTPFKSYESYSFEEARDIFLEACKSLPSVQVCIDAFQSDAPMYSPAIYSIDRFPTTEDFNAYVWQDCQPIVENQKLDAALNVFNVLCQTYEPDECEE